MIISKKEVEFLESLEESRIATSHDDIPHVKPVSFVFYHGLIVVATDYETRTYQNIKKNPRVAISIDIYKPGDHKAMCIQGDVEVLEKGEEYELIYQIFYNKFKWVRDDPWEPEEAPILKIVPKHETSWGIN